MAACDFLTADGDDAAVPIAPVRKDDLAAFLEQNPALSSWVRATGFAAEPGTHCVVPSRNGHDRERAARPGQRADVGLGQPAGEAAAPASTASRSALPSGEAADAAFGWALATYRFDRYRRHPANLRHPAVAARRCDRAAVQSAAEATFLVRDLINTPASDLGPGELVAAVEAEGRRLRRALHGHRRRRRCWPGTTRPSMPSVAPARGRRAWSIWSGATTPRPRSPWSARASASTPAGSTSSRRVQ